MKSFLIILLLLIVAVFVGLILKPEHDLSQKFFGYLNISVSKNIEISQEVDLTDCISYFDGCNTCMVEDGVIGGCTKMFCETPTEPRCLEYTTELADEDNSSFSNDDEYCGLHIKGVDVETFKLLGQYYCKDKYFVWGIVGGYPNRLSKIDSADPNTFQLIDDKWCAKDKNNIYFNGQIVKGVDLYTFECKDNYIAKDKNYVWAKSYLGPSPELIKLEGANPSTFKFFQQKDCAVYYKDKYSVYINGDRCDGHLIKIEGSDPVTFEVLESPGIDDEFQHFSKDKNNMYNGTLKIQGVD